MIKKILFSITSLICLTAFTCVGQTALIIDPHTSGCVAPLMKMIGPFPKNDESYYNIDVDNNGVIDFRITTEGYDSGSKKDYTITFEALDNSSFAIDTVTGHGQHPDSMSNPVHVDFSVPVVKMYNEHEVIYANQCTESKRFLMSCYSYISYDGVHPSMQEVDNWISGIHYIGIKKVIQNKTYLGWIKLEIINPQEVYLDSYTRMNIAEPITGATNDFIIYPNPTHSLVTIAGISANKIEFYNALGSLVLTAENPSGAIPFTVDLTPLSNGVYITKIIPNGNEKNITRKVVKQ
jgi:hypothetical protein